MREISQNKCLTSIYKDCSPVQQKNGLMTQDAMIFRPFDEIWNPGFMPLSMVVKNVNKDGGIKSSFLDSKEIKNIYKKFKIISIIEEVKTDIVSKEKYAAWYLILKK